MPKMTATARKTAMPARTLRTPPGTSGSATQTFPQSAAPTRSQPYVSQGAQAKFRTPAGQGTKPTPLGMDPESETYKKFQQMFQNANERQHQLKTSLAENEKKVQELENQRTQLQATVQRSREELCTAQTLVTTLQKKVDDLQTQLVADADSRNRVSRADLETTLYEIRSQIEAATRMVTQKISESQKVLADSQMPFAGVSQLDLPDGFLEPVNVGLPSVVDPQDLSDFDQYVRMS